MMPARDFFKTASLIKEPWLPSRYCIRADVTAILLNKAITEGPEGMLKVMEMCIRYGYVMGHRATLNGAYKEQKPRKKNPSSTHAWQGTEGR